jgi:ABC-type glycerol-3-phosphate transport system permease component
MFFTTLFAIFAAYGFTRFNFRFGKFISTGLLFGQMIPSIILLIPLYRIYSTLRMIDTYQVNIISNMSVNMPMAVLTLTAFLRNVPKELDEAAMIDGCIRSRALFQVLLPICTPGVTTVCIFSFLNTWEEFLFAFNFTNSARYKTLSIALKEFKGQFIIDWSGMMSAAVVIAIPVLLIFVLCNKYFIRGITSGAIKG